MEATKSGGKAFPAALYCAQLQLPEDAEMAPADQWSPDSQNSDATEVWVPTCPPAEAAAPARADDEENLAAWVCQQWAAGEAADSAWAGASDADDSDVDCSSSPCAGTALCDGLLGFSPRSATKPAAPVAAGAPAGHDRLLEDLAACGSVYQWCTQAR